MVRFSSLVPAGTVLVQAFLLAGCPGSSTTGEDASSSSGDSGVFTATDGGNPSSSSSAGGASASSASSAASTSAASSTGGPSSSSSSSTGGTPDAGRPDAAMAMPDAGRCLDCFVPRTGFPVTLPLPPARLGSIHVGDVTGDGAREIVLGLESTAHDQAVVAVVTAAGALTPTSHAGGITAAGGVLVDVNADSIRDYAWGDFVSTVHAQVFTGPAAPMAFPLTIGSPAPVNGMATWADAAAGQQVINFTINANIHRLETDGDVASGWPNEGSQSPFEEGVVACQLVAGGGFEVVGLGQASSALRLVALDSTGLYVTGFPTSTVVDTGAFPPTCVDVDADGLDEVVFGEDSGEIHVFGANGAPRTGFPFQGGPQLTTAISAGNLVGSSAPELVFGSRLGNHPGSLVAVGADGVVLPGFPVRVDGLISGSVLVADTNGDGTNELIAVTILGSLYVVRADGSVVSGFPVAVGGNPIGAPALEDLDGNGTWELLVATQTRLLVGTLRGSSSATHAPWTRYRGDDGRTGRYRGEAPSP